MISTEDIQKLLEKFISGKISQEDEKELFDLVNKQELDGKITAWLYRRWDESSTRSIGFHSVGIYEKIRNNLNLHAQSSKEERDYANYVMDIENRKSSKFFLQFFKYAVVFIFAAASSYYLARFSGFGEKFVEGDFTEVRAENGSKSTILLPDSTVIKLNSDSYLRYPTNFTGMNRQVYFEGEAFFKVKTGLPHPFYVNTGNISIKVTGTEFNVKSFPDDEFIETTLISGSIIIEEFDEEKQSKNQVVLNPNQLAVYHKSTSKLEITDLVIEEEIKKEIIPKQAVRITTNAPIIKSSELTTAWKDDKFVFYNERLDELSIRLERWFDVNIEIVDEDLKEFRYIGTFENETIEQAMDALQLASTLTLASTFTYQINDDQITITK
jgi:ferric-dicitrate binding protein FerR (iron transport regulator)